MNKYGKECVTWTWMLREGSGAFVKMRKRKYVRGMKVTPAPNGNLLLF